MIIPEHYSVIRYQRSARLQRYSATAPPRTIDLMATPPEISFRVCYWMQPKPSTEELAGDFMTGFSDAEPLGHKVYVVRGWECASCKTRIFTAGWDGLDHPCPDLGDALHNGEIHP